MKGFFVRLRALVIKEVRQMARDRSALLIGLVLPVLLISIFGYGLSMDVNNVPIAVTMEKDSPLARDVLAGLNGSPYFAPRWATSLHEAEELMHRREVDAILHLPADFDSRYVKRRAEAQLIVHGVDSTTSTLIGQYVNGLLALHSQTMLAKGGNTPGGSGMATVQPRMWFNEAGTSTWYLVPGIIVIVMTLVGAFLTALIMAREWERGTLEALFVTPAGRAEILLAKLIPYFLLGMGSLLLCLAAARWLFFVPMRGSLPMFLLSSSLYLVTALGMGLVISSAVRSQFLACQISLMASLLPAIILSGFFFDLRSVPLVARIAGNILPATWFMEIMKTLFLAGDNMNIIGRNCLVLLGYAATFMALAARFTRKSLD